MQNITNFQVKIIHRIAGDTTLCMCAHVMIDFDSLIDEFFLFQKFNFKYLNPVKSK